MITVSQSAMPELIQDAPADAYDLIKSAITIVRWIGGGTIKIQAGSVVVLVVVVVVAPPPPLPLVSAPSPEITIDHQRVQARLGQRGPAKIIRQKPSGLFLTSPQATRCNAR